MVHDTLTATSDSELFDSLVSATEERATLHAEREHADKLGVVIGGSLFEGLEVKLDATRVWRTWSWAATSSFEADDECDLIAVHTDPRAARRSGMWSGRGLG
jgi:hypothetical protein